MAYLRLQVFGFAPRSVAVRTASRLAALGLPPANFAPSLRDENQKPTRESWWLEAEEDGGRTGFMSSLILHPSSLQSP
ncbi:MAG: hypothetical protein HY774_27985 [Acidobacteria bacterium]|nr:hypothetical protein [Acidobacteriota bacterium]